MCYTKELFTNDLKTWTYYTYTEDCRMKSQTHSVIQNKWQGRSHQLCKSYSLSYVTWDIYIHNQSVFYDESGVLYSEGRHTVCTTMTLKPTLSYKILLYNSILLQTQCKMYSLCNVDERKQTCLQYFAISVADVGFA